jgi:NAD-dependent SIR2 family protein deacetylase
MVRISIPTLPLSTSVIPSIPVSFSEALSILQQFLSDGPVTVLTGAGVSVDSGIRAYRGNDGRYMNPNYRSVLHAYLQYSD